MNSYPHTLIRASAGTGKTFQLSNRYLGLMQAGAMPDQILATTFTRKAAGEILDRVVVRLAEAALNEPARRELAKWLSSPSLSQDRCHQLLQVLIRQLHRLKICTLDSFFAQLAGSFSLELGLPPDSAHHRAIARQLLAKRGDRDDAQERLESRSAAARPPDDEG